MHRCTGGDRVGLAALILDGLDSVLPALADANVEAVVDKAAVGAHQAGHQDVADAIINGVIVWHPILLDHHAFHADLGGGRGDHSCVVRLHPTDRDKRVRTRGDCVRHGIFQFAQLVPPMARPELQSSRLA